MRVYWLNDETALCTGWSIESRVGATWHWWRFNCRTGKVLNGGSIDTRTQNSLLNSLGELTEDGKHLLVIHGSAMGGWGRTVRGELVDTATLRSRSLGQEELDREPTGDFGLVPGGKYFHIGSHIFDRRTLKRVAAKDFPRDRLCKVAFSPDGSRYAAVVSKVRGAKVWPGVDTWPSNRQYPVIVRVHETLTGRILLAFSPPPPASQLAYAFAAVGSQIAFSPDGQRLATVNDDGSIEVRSVPSARSE